MKTDTLSHEQMIGAISQIPRGEGRTFKVGRRVIAVFRTHTDAVYATQAECTHEGGPLNEGKLEGETVTCPLHGSCFNIKTGALVHGPARQPIQTFRVAIHGTIGSVESLRA